MRTHTQPHTTTWQNGAERNGAKMGDYGRNRGHTQTRRNGGETQAAGRRTSYANHYTHTTTGPNGAGRNGAKKGNKKEKLEKTHSIHT